MRIASRWIGAVFACGASAVVLGAAPAMAAQAATSRNWSGYAVVPKSGGKLRRVSASWVVQKPNCSTRSPGYSGDWVGLGGFAPNAIAVEQVGVDANCNSAGKRRYGAWYELVPAPGHNIALGIHGGDRMSASVEVQGKTVTLKLRNRTTGAVFSKTANAPAPDVRSAEWIVEAPQSCDDSGNCKILPLADFGSVPFGSAAATTSAGTKKTISDSAFTAYRVTMRPAGKSYGATPSSLSSGGTAFSVSYRRQLARR